MEKNKKIFPFFYKEWKRTQRSERSFIKNGKDAKIVPFFYKEWKRTQRLFCSFIKNGKNSRMLRSFEKNGCPLPNPDKKPSVKGFKQKVQKKRPLAILGQTKILFS